MKKLLPGIAVLFLLLLGTHLSVLFLAGAAARRAIGYVSAEAGRHGVRVLEFHYEDALFSLPGTLHWTGLGVRVRVERPSPLQGKNLKMTIGKASAHVDSFSERTFRLRLHEVMVNAQAGAGGGSRGVAGDTRNLIRAKEAGARFRIDSFTTEGLSRLAEELKGHLRSFLSTGRTSLPITFSGLVSFPLKKKELHARIRVVRQGGNSVLIMDEEDVRLISRKLELEKPLTDAEVSLIARNPLRANRLFQIRTYAQARSRDARRFDHTVPEDAYRHVLWSYLLAKEFGEGFSKEVTDAHEEGRTGNTREERRMDLGNNRIGREYAVRGVEEDQLLRLALRDPRVIRRPASP